ncbi:MAG: hypothetical protein MJZ30_11560 [Paludibacteraceae bacterium]|nr:hypothetical protein [Paludibacteraceae bacterium]
METNIRITSLSHEDLVEIFSTGTYGNCYIDVDYQDEDENTKFGYSEDDCYEDKIAKCLLNGGSIKVIDIAADGEEEKEDVEHYGERGKNWDKKMYRRINGYWYPVYVVSLPTLINGLSNPEAYNLLKELIDEENGDVYTAYNAIQIAVFGEEVYG